MWGLVWSLLALPWMAACVLPVPGSLDDPDAGVLDADPVIIDSNPVMPYLKPLVANQQFSVTLRDADLKDTLFLRIFRNYETNPGPIDAVMVPNDIQNPKEVRGPVSLNTGAWCPGALAGTTITVDVMVADRPFDADITRAPQYRVVTQNGKGSIRSWVLTCPVQ
jgi:hypothetical protein